MSGPVTWLGQGLNSGPPIEPFLPASR